MAARSKASDNFHTSITSHVAVFRLTFESEIRGRNGKTERENRDASSFQSHNKLDASPFSPRVPVFSAFSSPHFLRRFSRRRVLSHQPGIRRKLPCVFRSAYIILRPIILGDLSNETFAIPRMSSRGGGSRLWFEHDRFRPIQPRRRASGYPGRSHHCDGPESIGFGNCTVPASKALIG
jgi:hypothetical protein